MIACMNFKVLFLSTHFLSVETIKCVTDLSNLSLSRKPEFSVNVVSRPCNVFEEEEEEEEEAVEEEDDDDDDMASEDECGAAGALQSSPCKAEKYV